MQTGSTAEIQTDRIAGVDRLRKLSQNTVDELVVSIGATGLLHPIVVVKIAAGDDTAEATPSHRLVAGAHRLAAARSLGWSTIPASVLDLDENERIIAECDENLRGSKLSPAERAKLTHERKRAYERSHPETKHGAVGRGRPKSCQIGNSISFAKDMAEKTGQSERDISRQASRGANVAPEVLDAMVQTSLDTGVALDQLSRMPRAEQPAALHAMKTGLNPDAPVSARRPAQAKVSLTPSVAQDDNGKMDPTNESAAIWLYHRLGNADAQCFVRILGQESSVGFVQQFQDLVRNQTDVEEVEAVVYAAASLTAADATLDAPASSKLADANGCDSELQDAPSPPTTIGHIACSPAAARSTDETRPVAEVAEGEHLLEIHEQPLATVFEITASAEPLSRLRPSNWVDKDACPSVTDRCQECGSGTFAQNARGVRWYCTKCHPGGC